MEIKIDESSRYEFSTMTNKWIPSSKVVSKLETNPLRQIERENTLGVRRL